MPEGVARCAPLGLLVLATFALPATISAHGHAEHHHKTAEHESARHKAEKKTSGKKSPEKKTKSGHREPTHHDKASPAGATTVPEGGLKIYCAGRKSPLLVRKSTQGNGTTVTVVCR